MIIISINIIITAAAAAAAYVFHCIIPLCII